MQNRGMERSAAYSGIVGAIIFVASGLMLGQYPSSTAASADIAAYLAAHGAAVVLGAWLTLPAVAFILWFAAGFFDYLRDPADHDRTLAQWGMASAVVWAAIMIATAALQAAVPMRSPGPSASLPALYLSVLVLFTFGMGAFGAFAFAVANESRRKGTMPSWLNALAYLVFVVDVLETLSIFGSGGSSITGIGAYVVPLLSALWIIAASIVLLVRVPRPAQT
jgi:hypothetical protein